MAESPSIEIGVYIGVIKNLLDDLNEQRNYSVEASANLRNLWFCINDADLYLQRFKALTEEENDV